MATAHFELAQEMSVAPAVVQSFLCDLRNFAPLHPLIESIEELPAHSERPRARRYRVVDRVPVGPFRMRVSYTAALEAIGENEVHGDAWQFPRVRLHTRYQLHPSKDGTSLVERVEVDAPWPLLASVARQAERAHAETLAGVKRLLEEASSQPS